MRGIDRANRQEAEGAACWNRVEGGLGSPTADRHWAAIGPHVDREWTPDAPPIIDGPSPQDQTSRYSMRRIGSDPSQFAASAIPLAKISRSMDEDSRNSIQTSGIAVDCR